MKKNPPTPPLGGKFSKKEEVTPQPLGGNSGIMLIFTIQQSFLATCILGVTKLATGVDRHPDGCLIN